MRFFSSPLAGSPISCPAERADLRVTRVEGLVDAPPRLALAFRFAPDAGRGGGFDAGGPVNAGSIGTSMTRRSCCWMFKLNEKCGEEVGPKSEES